MIKQKNFIVVIVLLALLSVGLFLFSTLGKKKTESSAERTPNIQGEQDTQAKPIRMVFMGDVMLSRSVGKKMEEKNDFGYPARKIADFFKDADIVAVNLEGPMSNRGTNIGSKYSFRADPRAVETLNLLNVSVVSLSNNHIWDYDADALTDTFRILSEGGIFTVGAAGDWSHANGPKIKEVSGTRIGFLSYTNLYPENLEAGTNSPGISSFDEERVSGEIRKIKSERQADILVVLLHWGVEYEPHPTAKQRKTAHALVDAGADLIVGTHPHVAQDVEQYNPPSREATDGQRTGWIFYSLGNFIFDQYFSEETMKGLVVEAFAEKGKITDVKIWESFLDKEYQVESISQK